MTDILNLDYPFHVVFGREDLAPDDNDRHIVLDGRIIGTIPAKRRHVSPAIHLAARGADKSMVIGPSFDLDVLRKRVIRVLFNNDDDAFARAELR